MQELNTDWKNEISEVIVNIARLMVRIIGKTIDEETRKESLLMRFAIKIEGRRLQKEMSPYIGAAVMLAFEGKEPEEGKLANILHEAGITPDHRMLSFASSLKFKASVVYAPALYFLRVSRKSDSLENLMKAVKAIGVEPDEHIAREVMALDAELTNGTKVSAMQQDLDASLKPASDMMAKFMLMELNRTFEKGDINNYINKGFIPYLAAVGTLVYAGRDINIEGEESFLAGIANLVSSIGIARNDEMLSYIKSFNYGNTALSYVPPIAYIKSLGKEPTIHIITKLLEIIGIPYDESLAGYAIAQFV